MASGDARAGPTCGHEILKISAPELTTVDVARIIEMAWEDRTPFEAIEAQFGLNESAVVALMRAELKRTSFKVWRARMAARTTKHAALRDPAVVRHRAVHTRQA